MRLFGVSMLSLGALLGCGTVAHHAQDETSPPDPTPDAGEACAPSAAACDDCDPGAFVWSRVLGGPKEDFGRSLAIAEDGDVLLGGSFAESVELCGTAVQSAGRRDGYVVRFDPDGRLRWHRELGNAAGPTVVESIALHDDGTLLVTGSQPGFTEVGPESGSLPRAAFVTEMSAGGATQWTRLFNSRDSAVGTSVAVAPEGAAVVAGSFSTALEVGAETLETQGVYSAFVAKLSRAGEPLWAAVLGGSDTVVGRDVAVDSQGNVFVLVDAMDQVALEVDGVLWPAAELVVVGLDSSGAVRMVEPVTYDGASDCDCRVDGLHLRVAPGDALVVSGTYAEAAGTHEHTMFYQEAFVQRMLPGGTFSVLSRWMGSARGLAVAPEGDMLVSGDFFDSTDIDGHRLIATGFSDAFAARLAPDGSVTWATSFGTSALDMSSTAAVGPRGEMYVAGALGDHHAGVLGVDFGGGAMTTADQTDAFIAKYAW